MIRYSVWMFVFIASCGAPEYLLPEQLNNWVNKEENGLIRTKTIQNVKLTAKFLPSELLAYREWITLESSHIPFDSIVNEYRQAAVFQFTMEADKLDKKYGSLMYYEAFSQEDLSYRINLLSFQIESFLSLRDGENKYFPVLSHFEGFDQIGNKITFQASFILSDFDQERFAKISHDVVFSFDDPIWGLGTNHFEFKRKDLHRIPKLKLDSRS